MKKILAVLLLVILFTGCTQKDNLKDFVSTNRTKTISCPDMEEEVKSGGLLIDVRNPDEYEKEHMDNAINIPSLEIAEKIEEYATTKDVAIILYCQSGVRANESAMLLMDMGYTNVYSLGGIRKCKK